MLYTCPVCKAPTAHNPESRPGTCCRSCITRRHPEPGELRTEDNPFCTFDETTSRRTGSFVGRKFGNLIDLLDLIRSSVDGPAEDFFGDFRQTVMRRLEMDGWTFWIDQLTDTWRCRFTGRPPAGGEREDVPT